MSSVELEKKLQFIAFEQEKNPLDVERQSVICELGDDSLRIYSSNQLYCIARLALNKITVVGSVRSKKFKGDYIFQVKNLNAFYYFFTSNRESKRKWIRGLRRAITSLNGHGGHVLTNRFHPGVWSPVLKEWSCCHQAYTTDGCLIYGADSGSNTSHESSASSASNVVKAICIVDRPAANQGEISLVKNNFYEVIDDRSPLWVVSDSHGTVGTAPASCFVECELNIESFTWFHPDITVEESEKMLLKKNYDGYFLVRKSSLNYDHRFPYTLSLLHMNGNRKGVIHRRVRCVDVPFYTKYYQFDGERLQFRSVQSLIQFHRHNPVDLPTALKYPLVIDSEDDAWKQPSFSRMEIIESNEVKFGGKIGSGSFGEVHYGTYKEMPVAVKMLKTDNMREDELIEEAKTMSSLHHPNIVRLIGIIVSSEMKMRAIVMEYMENGSLKNFLKCNPNLGDQQLMSYVVQVASAMRYLEEMSIVHRDLATRNVLVGSNGAIAKVCDLGLAKFMYKMPGADGQYIANFSHFPVKWSAPEVLEYGLFSSKSDVWSFGVTLWEIFSLGDDPYRTQHLHKTDLLPYLRGRQRLARPSRCPQEVYELMQEMWRWNRDDRPTFADIYETLNEIYALLFIIGDDSEDGLGESA